MLLEFHVAVVRRWIGRRLKKKLYTTVRHLHANPVYCTIVSYMLGCRSRQLAFEKGQKDVKRVKFMLNVELPSLTR